MQLCTKAIFKDSALHPLTLISPTQSISERWYQEWKTQTHTCKYTQEIQCRHWTWAGQRSFGTQCNEKETSTQVHFDAEETKYELFFIFFLPYSKIHWLSKCSVRENEVKLKLFNIYWEKYEREHLVKSTSSTLPRELPDRLKLSFQHTKRSLNFTVAWAL